VSSVSMSLSLCLSLSRCAQDPAVRRCLGPYGGLLFLVSEVTLYRKSTTPMNGEREFIIANLLVRVHHID